VPRAEEITPAIMNLLETISGDRDLETALEESLQVCMNT
jgi:E3 ubiquitin-protein ligase AIP2